MLPHGKSFAFIPPALYIHAVTITKLTLMSQSATFYPLTPTEFEALSKDQSTIGDLLADKAFTTMHSTHEGLRYMLAKGRDEATVKTIDEIFYPLTYIEQGGVDDEEEEEYEGEPIGYHAPQQVAAIAALLESITPEEIQRAYNPEELNREKVYPWCWNREPGDKNAFNEEALLENFHRLKKLFLSAHQNGDFVLIFVG